MEAAERSTLVLFMNAIKLTLTQVSEQQSHYLEEKW